MKKILVPTDFSKLADNALTYAVQLAKQTGAELQLLHVYNVPDLLYDPLLIIPTEDELKQEILQDLEKIKDTILIKNPELKVTCHITSGIPVDEINSYAKKRKIDLIVAGAQGAGYIKERIMGSTASILIREAKTPIIVIPKKVKFKHPKQIVLAVDFQETDNIKALKPLIDIAKIYDSHVCILNIYPHTRLIPALEEISEGFSLDHSLKEVMHTFFSIESNQIIPSINDFVKHHKIELIVMIARKHSIINRLFREPLTKKMSFQSNVPLFVLHE